MSTERIPFHVPSLDELDVEGVVEVLRSGWVTTGPKSREFEERFAEFVAESSGETVHAIAVNSCTSALHLALEACGVGPGDLVIVPVMTFTATAEVVRYLGADPVFVDVEMNNSNLTVMTVKSVVDRLSLAERARIKALVPVHYGGLACDMDALESLCDEYGWLLVDDAAHALPTRYRNRWIGRWGHASAFSFYSTKTLCTGEGGMVVTRDPKLASRIRLMRLHGIDRDSFDRYRSERPAWYYEIVAPGFKYNLGDIAASLGLSQLQRLHEFREARARIAALYREGFKLVDGIQLPEDAPPGDVHAWHLFPLRVSGGRLVRDALIETLADQKIGTSVHFIPLHMHPYWRDRYDLQPAQFPVASQLFEEEISLPIFVSMSDSQIERVVSAVTLAIQQVRQPVRLRLVGGSPQPPLPETDQADRKQTTSPVYRARKIRASMGSSWSERGS